ncbi:probable serine/threonine-protein kinase DDB_G0282963 [Diaphorina citri]|uniref:Probable serine/threonine-protein kinase DDB_G0282963 n=1 Tax=Diaphorina citri TaxID=121845 RepID=A0A3Q0IZH8_DIACI|nr:probable serine/threonine-protein kinase DDB_G0282963 [Diaphorina citri]
MYGSVQSLNRMGSQVVITYAVKAEAMAAVTYSQREVKLVCNDPDHIVCGRTKSRSSSISDQFNPTQIDPNPQLFAFEDTAAAVFNPLEELEDAISNVNSETASIRTSDEEMTDSDSETVDEDSDEEREDEKKYEGVDINELDKLIGLDVNKAKEIKELDVNKSKEVTVDPDINKGVSNEVKDDADVPNIHEDEVTGRDTNVTNELAGKHDNDSGEKDESVSEREIDEKDENLVENLDGKCHSENGYEKEETLKRTKDVEKLHEGIGDDIEKEDTLLQKNEDSDETKSETSTSSAKLELPSNIPDEILQDMSNETRDVESRVESPETKALPEQLENIQDTLVADYLDTLVDIGKSEWCSMSGEKTKKELVSSADKIESEKDTLRSDIVANTDASDPDTEPKCVVKEEFIEATSSPNANTNSSNDVANKDINSQVETNKLLEESSASSVSSANDVTVINLMDEVTVANPTESNLRELEQRNLPSTTESFEGIGECDSGKEYSTDETTLPIEKGNPEDDQNESNETIRADGSAQIEKSTAVDHLDHLEDAKDTLEEYEKAFDKEPETITSGYGRMRSNEIESKDDEMGNNTSGSNHTINEIETKDDEIGDNTSGSNHTINEIETKDDEIGDNVSNTLEHADPVSKSEESEDSNPEPMVRKPSSTDSSSRDDHLESIKQALETLPDTDRSITLEKIKAWLANSEGEVDENDTKLGVNVEDCDSQKEEVDENDGQTVEDGNDSSDGSEDDNDDVDNSGDKRDAERVNPSVYTLVDGSAGISQTSTSVRSVEVSGSNSNASVTIADVYLDNYYPCVTNTDAYATNTDAYVTNTDASVTNTDAYVTNTDAYVTYTDAYATNSDDYVTKTDASVTNTTFSNPYVMSSALSTPAARPSSIEFTPWSNDSDESEYYEDFVDDLNEATGTDLSEQRRDFVVGMDLNHQWRDHDRQYEDSRNQECQRCNQPNTDRTDYKQECREQCEKCNHANTDRMDYKQISKYNQAGATGNQKHKAKKATEPSKKLCLSEILTDFSKLCGDNYETGGPLKLDLDSEDEDAKERTTENEKTAKNENKPSKPCLRQTNPWKVHENIVERNRTVSERSNDSVASNRSRKLSQQSNESVRSETAKKSKPSKDNSGVCNTKPVLVNTGLDTGGPSSSDSWTEVVRKNLGMRVTAKAPPPSQILQDGCGQKLKKHLVAKFPSVSTDTLISLVKNVRREHGNHLTGLSFELIETLVSLQLAKQANVTESSSSGWEKFTGKAWADTKTPKTAEWKSTGQDECIICMYPLGNRIEVGIMRITHLL